MLLFRNTPWAEDDIAPSRAAIVTVHKARSMASRFEDRLPGLRIALRQFRDDLQVIEAAYRASPDAYRRSRALTAVHLPSLLDSLEKLAQMRASGVDSDRIDIIQDDIRTCLGATTEARARIDNQAIDTLTIEVETLADSLPAQDPSAHEGGLLARTLDQGRNQIGRKLGSVTSFAGEIGSAAKRRAEGGWSAARITLGGALGEIFDSALTPVRVRMSAAFETALSASLDSLASGAIMSIIFPPLAPLTAGLAILEAGETYNRAVAHGTNDAKEAREARRLQRDEALTGALARLKGQSPIMRMESPCLHVTLDLENGYADGLVLAGRHAGETLADLDRKTIIAMRDTAPDQDTRAILDSWMTRIGA